MKKKALVIISTIIIIALTAVTVGLNVYKSKSVNTSSYIVEYKTVITEPKELERLAKKTNAPAPEGCKLEKINILQYTDEKEADFSGRFYIPSFIYEIKNVQRAPYEYRYTQPDYADIMDAGSACKFSGVYASDGAAKTHYKTKIRDSVVSRAVKYDIAKYQSIEKKYTTPEFAKGEKKVYLRAYTTYACTEFDIYNKFTGKLKEKNAGVSVPNGLIFIQYTYAK